MNGDTLREMMRDPNFFHHFAAPYLSRGAGSLDNPSVVVRDGIDFLSQTVARGDQSRATSARLLTERSEII